MTRAFALIAVLAHVLAPLAFAGPAGAASAPEPGEGSHGWVVVQETDDGWRLVHLPPRGFGQGAAEAGQIRPVRELASEPVAIAATGRRVFLLFADEGRTRVYSLRAVPAAGGFWSIEPANRYDAHPALMDGDPVIGAAASPEGLVVLGEPGESGRLWRLEQSGWVAIDLHPTLVDRAGLRLVDFGDHWAVLDTTEPSLWSIEDPEAGRWTSSPLSATPGQFDDVLAIFGVPGALAWVSRDGEVWVARERGVFRVMAFDGPPGPAVAAPIRVGSGRVAILFLVDEGGADPFRLVELSLGSGAVLFDGPPKHAPPVSAGEFRALAAALLMVMLIALLLTLGPRVDPDAVTIPEGLALAEPGRRLAASLFDLALVALLSSAIFGVGLFGLVTGLVLIMPGNGWVAVPAMLGLGIVIGTLGEWGLGWTPGKLITGCRVVPLGTERHRLPLLRALVRNVVKWLLPPVAALALVDPSGRHRGEAMSGSAVVVALEPEE